MKFRRANGICDGGKERSMWQMLRGDIGISRGRILSRIALLRLEMPKVCFGVESGSRLPAEVDDSARN